MIESVSTPSETYTDMRGCVAAAAELVERLSDTEIHALILGDGEVVVEITTADADAERVATDLGLTRDAWWWFLLLSPSRQWSGTWRGVEVTLRNYNPRPLRARVVDLLEARS